MKQRPEFAIWHQPYGSGAARLVSAIVPQAGGVWSGFAVRFDGKSFLNSQTVGGAADVVVARLPGFE